MTRTTLFRSVVPRFVRIKARLTSANARLTCSSVISGFFSPQPIRMLGYEDRRQQAQDHVPHQAYPGSALEVSKAQFRLGHSKSVSHVPASERHFQQRLDRRILCRIGEEELLLSRLVRGIDSGNESAPASNRAFLDLSWPHTSTLAGRFFRIISSSALPMIY
jgi:hypothetical protein